MKDQIYKLFSEFTLKNKLFKNENKNKTRIGRMTHLHANGNCLFIDKNTENETSSKEKCFARCS